MVIKEEEKNQVFSSKKFFHLLYIRIFKNNYALWQQSFLLVIKVQVFSKCNCYTPSKIFEWLRNRLLQCTCIIFFTCSLFYTFSAWLLMPIAWGIWNMVNKNPLILFKDLYDKDWLGIGLLKYFFLNKINFQNFFLIVKTRFNE